MIIIVNGSRHAGKSTVAQLLSSKLPRAAYIPIDELRKFVPFLVLEDSIALNIEHAILITKNLVKKKYNVVLDYCLRQKDYSKLIRELGRIGVGTYTITLKPDPRAILNGRGKRTITKDDRKRISEQYNPSSSHFVTQVGLVMDTTGQTPQTTVEIILKHIHLK